MLRGDLYLAGDPELTMARTRARRLWQRFNAVDPADGAGLRALLAELLGRLAQDAWIEPPFYCEYGSQIRLEAGVFVNMNCVFLDPVIRHLASADPAEAG